MKKLCPNLDREDGLETVLEVPIPEEIVTIKSGTWQNMKQWMKPKNESRSSRFGDGHIDTQLLLGALGAPLIPFPSTTDYQPIITRTIIGHNLEDSMAKYIVKQYVAVVGGESVLNSVESMYAMGRVRIGTSEGCVNSKKMVKNVEMGGFVVWQKMPDLWCLELVVSDDKIIAGSDGKVVWTQTPWHHSHAFQGPPTPLRRLFQGLDPRSTANLFNNSTCIGEKTVNNEECFILKLEAESTSLQASSSSDVEKIDHTVLGYFSQKTGLLVQLEDSNLIKIKSSSGSDTGIWETNTESLIQDYRIVDDIRIAHSGKTTVSLSRFGEGLAESHLMTRIIEVWQIEEVDFNIKGLSMDCFLPPSDLKRDEEEEEEEEEGVADCGVVVNKAKLPYKIRSASFKIGGSKVVAVDVDVDDMCDCESVEDM